MPFVQFIISNLLRQKIRTGLTVLGISIGITAVVALGIITESALKATGDLFRAGNADLAIGRAGNDKAPGDADYRERLAGGLAKHDVVADARAKVAGCLIAQQELPRIVDLLYWKQHWGRVASTGERGPEVQAEVPLPR